MNEKQLVKIIEAVLFAADAPMSLNQLLSLFDKNSGVDKEALIKAIESIQQDCHNRSIELREVANGYRYQVKQDYAEWVSKLWEDKPAKYSRATLETLALIAYRQPITRAEIEEVRGVSVSSQIIKSMTERNWIKVVGHRDVPGKPALFATTKEFLDYFNLKSLQDLPSLAELRDIDAINAELNLGLMDETLHPADEDENNESSGAASNEATEQSETTGDEINEAEVQVETTEQTDESATEKPGSEEQQENNEEVIAEAVSAER